MNASRCGTCADLMRLAPRCAPRVSVWGWPRLRSLRLPGSHDRTLRDGRLMLASLPAVDQDRPIVADYVIEQAKRARRCEQIAQTAAGRAAPRVI